MENKYYTPDIEEFHIGFECEVNWARGYTHNFEPFVFKIVDTLPDGSIDAYNSNVDDALIAYDDGYAEFRVKYLDKEDIESLGWNHDHSLAGELDEFVTNIYRMDRDFVKYSLSHNFNGFISISQWEFHDITNPKTSTLFNGNIKNKSELKKLMKQLNII